MSLVRLRAVHRIQFADGLISAPVRSGGRVVRNLTTGEVLKQAVVNIVAAEPGAVFELPEGEESKRLMRLGAAELASVTDVVTFKLSSVAEPVKVDDTTTATTDESRPARRRRRPAAEDVSGEEA